MQIVAAPSRDAREILLPLHSTVIGLGVPSQLGTLAMGNLKGATFKAHSKCETVLAGSNTISVSLQVAFIIAGSTHATYCKTLGHSLGIDVVSSSTFMCTIRAMHSIVESMLDEVCEAAKQEMRDVKESQLGWWKNAVTVADCTWQTRGWHSKNFTIRNYLTSALLYYHHLCQKGRDEVIEEELYRGTSKSAEGWQVSTSGVTIGLVLIYVRIQ